MTSSVQLPALGNLSPGQRVPAIHVTAHNASLHSDNKIHDDEVAKRYGFAGGLVPGITVYAYMAQPLAAVAGARWLSHGGATVSLVHPLYEGDATTANAEVLPSDAHEQGRIGFDLWAENGAGQRCGTGSAWIGLTERTEPVPLPDYVAHDPGPPPAPRPDLALETAPVGQPLARLVLPTSAAGAREYADGVFETNPLFREGSPWGPPLLHPGWLLSNCNTIFSRSFAFGPWIHTRSEIEYLGPALAGRTLTLHGRLVEAFEKRQHHYAVLDLFCEDDTSAPVMHVRHTAIFKVHPRA
ncbi:MAG TPA: hypothetical protein VKV26_13075 [Dehalococcoidia bacterium]|nr:hypothetical protein [Dehalococcoidia bacterium]